MSERAHHLEKQLYKRLRRLSCDELWQREAARFNDAPPAARLAKVAVVRAVGVVFAESGTEQQKVEVRAWLRALLRDPNEKIRRYAMAALPKLGAGGEEEADLLSLLQTSTIERERRFIYEVLDQIGGTATLHAVAGEQDTRVQQTEQKVKARLLRTEKPSTVRLDQVLPSAERVTIHLHCRTGLEQIVRDELQSRRADKLFRVRAVSPGLVAVESQAAFCLRDLYQIRCFATVGFVLGIAVQGPGIDALEATARIVASPKALRLFNAFTEGPLRYRLDFAKAGHQRSAVRILANRIYAECPEILNDPQQAPWTVLISPQAGGQLVELSPKLVPDPRFRYRQDDVPAASHPPLAASLAFVAGSREHEVVWDPFCGSGVELIERALLGGVDRIYGTDLNPAALAATRRNFGAAGVRVPEIELSCCDFREFERTWRGATGTISLMVTNPPLGKRVPVADLRRLMMDVFATAARVLAPGGRLVLINPLQIEKPNPAMQLQFRQTVDVGLMQARLEKYVKVAPKSR